MKVLVIGQGGREHALCWALSRSPRVDAVYCAPGNPGIAQVARCVSIPVTDIIRLTEFATHEGIALTVVGPELPLALGIVDEFEARGLRIFGPRKAAAQLESSKSFAKAIMIEAGVPTAEARTFHSEAELRDFLSTAEIPLVLKADGLAAGKGVVVCHTADDVGKGVALLCQELKAEAIVVEQFLTGREASFIVATDGVRVLPFPSSHDYKRLEDNDEGPNTGGMGSVSPTPVLDMAQEARVVDEIIRPMLRRMHERGTPFKGFLYAGLMVEGDSIKVLEFNTRLGDPETQALVRRVSSDLFELLYMLSDTPVEPKELGASAGEISCGEDSAVCIVLASRGYPHAPELGDEVHGIELAEQLPGVKIFHAGTARNPSTGALITSGGRVLSVTAVGASPAEATRRAYQAADMIQFRGRQLRRDIGVK
jgi:phosphoribosylamine--glycine ligase